MTTITRVVFDTNVVISGRLWMGAPRQALLLADSGRVQSFVTEPMLDELRDVLQRPKFAKRIEKLGKTGDEIVADHLRTTQVIEPAALMRIIQADPDDDQIIACAVSCHADYVVSGDDHVLALRTHMNTLILDVSAFLAVFAD